MREGITFDDVLLVPKKGVLKTRKEADVRTKLSKNIHLNIPIVSANMDTVTEYKMAIEMARLGGIGIIHRFMTIEEQALHVQKVKRAENIIIENPYTVSPENSVRDVKQMIEKYNVKGFPVVENKKLVGIITYRDIRFEEDDSRKVKDVMTKDVVVLEEGRSIDEAVSILKTSKVDKLPIIDREGNLKGLITSKDIINLRNNKVALKDKKGRLMVGAAVGVKDHLKRSERLIEAGVDVIVVDIAHGHSEMAIKAIKDIKREFDIEVIGGNVATKEGCEDLIAAGADAVKVGVGPGATCITRIVTGFGVPQLTAVMDCYEISRDYGVPLIADGGIRNSGDIVKALAAGASSVMIGSLLAGTSEAPGITIMRRGMKYKVVRGMASTLANLSKRMREKENLEEDFTEYTAEGVEALVPFRGSVKEVITQLVNGIKSGISYGGARNIEELRRNAQFIKITPAGLRESHPHDVNVN